MGQLLPNDYPAGIGWNAPTADLPATRFDPKLPSRPLLVGPSGEVPSAQLRCLLNPRTASLFQETPRCEDRRAIRSVAPARFCKRSELPDSCGLLTSLQTLNADTL